MRAPWNRVFLMVSLLTLSMAGCASTSPATTDVPGATAAPAAAPAPAPATAGQLDPKLLAAIPPYTGALPQYALRDTGTSDAYRWAATHQLALQFIQCTCGCNQTSGHKSNYNCYVQSQNPDGTYIWDSMSSG